METKLTSVKILEEMYKKFKMDAFEKEFTLQKLVNRAMDLYVTDKDFKNLIENHRDLKISGSGL